MTKARTVQAPLTTQYVIEILLRTCELDAGAGTPGDWGVQHPHAVVLGSALLFL